MQVQAEQSQQVTQSKVTKERHVMELAELKSQLESELSEQVAETRRALQEVHAQAISSLMARHEEDLELLKPQEPGTMPKVQVNCKVRCLCAHLRI